MYKNDWGSGNCTYNIDWGVQYLGECILNATPGHAGVGAHPEHRTGDRLAASLPRRADHAIRETPRRGDKNLRDHSKK